MSDIHQEIREALRGVDAVVAGQSSSTAFAMHIETIRRTLTRAGEEIERWKLKAEAFEKGLEREVKRTMSEETKVVFEENERLRTQLREARETALRVVGDSGWISNDFRHEVLKEMTDALDRVRGWDE